jgi:hypothetical protein
VALPHTAHLGFGEAEIVGRRIDRLRAVHTHHDDLADRAHPGTARLVEGDRLVLEGARCEHGGYPLEAVALAEKRIDDVYLHVGVLSEVREGAR